VEVKAFLQLIRIHNVIGAMLGDLMGYLVSSFWHVNLVQMVLSMLVVGLVAGGGYVINDYFDVNIDKINKPDRPIPSGRISELKARKTALSMFVAGVLFSIPLGIVPFSIAMFTIVMLYLYAKDLKRTGIPGNLTVALTNGLSIFYGGLAYMEGDWLLKVILPTLYSFFLTLVREFVKGIEDYNGDKANSVTTLAVTKGIGTAWKISKILLILVIVVSPLPILFGFNLSYILLIVAAFIPSVVLSLIQKPSIESAAKARSYLKVSMLTGIVAFLLGSAPFIPKVYLSQHAYLILFQLLSSLH
jgi:geranylgeranylglycerol-phosphate geranylgeranyltransferase